MTHLQDLRWCRGREGRWNRSSLSFRIQLLNQLQGHLGEILMIATQR